MRMLATRIDQPVTGVDRAGLSVFSQDWWLSIVSASPDYHEAKVVRGNDVVGRLPFILCSNRPGFIWGYNPHWSRLAGPIVDERLSRPEQAEVIFSLLEQLPRWASFDFVCDPNLNYANIVRNAFKRAGFEHTSQITYVRPPERGDVLDCQKAKHRGHIKKAARELDCVEITAKEFVQFYEANLNAQRKRSYSPLSLLLRLIEEAVCRGQARAIAAKPKPENEQVFGGGSSPYDAAIVYVWDDERCYYWLSTRRSTFQDDTLAKPHPDATKVLAVKAMEDAQAMNLIFDADGVTTPGTDNLYHNVLGLKDELRRDVYQKFCVLERLRLKYRQRFKAFFAS
jgi:hypothetical protein